MMPRYLLAGTLAFALLTSAAAPSPVRVAAVEQRVITPTLPVSGTVHSKNDQQITAGIDGQIRSVAEPGTRVKKDDIVAQIDETPIRLLHKEQRAQVSRARAQRRFLRAQLTRQKALRKSDHVTDLDVEQAELDLSVAASDLRIAQTRVQQTEDRLRRATIRAQFDGIVVERARRAGEDVTRGTVLGRLADLDTLEVRALVPVKYGMRLAVGRRLTVFGYESRFAGIIHSVVPALNPRSQTFELRLDLPERAQQTWSIGQLVTLAVPTRKSAGTDGLAVPRDALILRQEGTHVFRIREDNTAERVAVQVGEGQGPWVAVRGSLNVGDRVAIRGAETLKDGASVEVLPPADREEQTL